MLFSELKFYYAVVAELVDARVLGTRILWCGSSSLPDRIQLFQVSYIESNHKSFIIKVFSFLIQCF